MSTTYLQNVRIGITTTIKALALTLGYFFRKPVTLTYPYRKKTIAARFRGFVRVPLNEEGKPLCIACGQCERVCPASAISIVTERDENNKKRLKEFYVDLGLCIYCGLCVESCPAKAIEHTTSYETASEHKESLRICAYKAPAAPAATAAKEPSNG